MKIFKYICLYIIVCLSLHQMYDEKTLTAILFHYPFIDFRYFLFVAVQYYWITLLYDIIFQYIILFPMMRIRIDKSRCFLILFKQSIIYCLFYLNFHILLLHLIKITIPLHLLFLNLFIQMICFWITIIFKKGWEYSYIFMTILMLFGHFICIII